MNEWMIDTRSRGFWIYKACECQGNWRL